MVAKMITGKAIVAKAIAEKAITSNTNCAKTIATERQPDEWTEKSSSLINLAVHRWRLVSIEESA